MSIHNFKGLKLFAHRIDEQLCEIIHRQLAKAIEEVESGLSETFKPETEAIIMFIFYACSLYLGRPTPGMMAMNLEFCSNRAGDAKSSRNRATVSSKFDWKLFLNRSVSAIFGNVARMNNSKDDVSRFPISNSGITCTENILNFRQNKYYRFLAICSYVLIIWTIKRLQRKAMIEGWRSAPEGSRKKKSWKLLVSVDFLSRILDLSNVCTFFLKGVYPTILYRLLDAKTVPISAGTGVVESVTDSIAGFSSAQLYVKSRQLLWQILSGLLSALTLSVDFRQIVTQGNDYAARMVKRIFLLVRKAIRDGDRVLRRLSGNFRFPGIGRTTGRNVPATADSHSVVSSDGVGGVGASPRSNPVSGTSNNRTNSIDSNGHDYSSDVNDNSSAPTAHTHRPTSPSSSSSISTSFSISISHLLASIMHRIVTTGSRSSLSIRRASHYLSVTVSNAAKFANEETRKILLFVLRIVLLGRM